MKKSEIIEALANTVGLTKADCERVFNATFALITSELAKGEEVLVPSFGTFKISDRPEHDGRNPTTGETIRIAASKGVSFKASAHLKDEVNK